MNCIQDNTKCYWEKSPQQKNSIVPTCTITNPCFDVMTFTKVKKIPKSVCNKTQALKSIQRRPICLTAYYHDYIHNGIKRGDTTG